MSGDAEIENLNWVADRYPDDYRVSLNLHALISLMYAQREIREGLRLADAQMLERGARSMSAALGALADNGCWIHAPAELPKP